MRLLRLAILAACLAPVALSAQTSFGPLHTEEAGPLQQVGVPHSTEPADLVPAKSIQLETWAGYSNLFVTDSTSDYHLLLDLERLATSVTLRGGLTSRVELGARIGLETTGGGILDRFINDWHHLLHLPNANRAKYPFNEYAQQLILNGALRLNVPKHTFGVEDVRVFAKWRAWQSGDGRHVVSMQLTGRVPMEPDLVGSERADAEIAALGRFSWTRWHLHMGLGASTVGASQNHQDILRTSSVFADLGLERSLNDRTSAVAQFSIDSPRLYGFHDTRLDGWPGNLVLGIDRQLSDRWLMNVSLQEDVPPDSPAADFTLGIGLRRRW